MEYLSIPYELTDICNVSIPEKQSMTLSTAKAGILLTNNNRLIENNLDS